MAKAFIINARPDDVELEIHDAFYQVAARKLEFDPTKVRNLYIAFTQEGVCLGVESVVEPEREEIVLAHITSPLMGSLLGPGIEEEWGGWIDRKPLNALQVLGYFQRAQQKFSAAAGYHLPLRAIRIQ